MERVLQNINDNKLIKKGDTIGVATSGGTDSMALLHYLAGLQEELDFEVVAIHVDHSIRENSAQDAFFVMDYCKKNRIRAYKFKIDVNKIAEESGQSIETAAREGRYGVFDSLLKKGIVDKIALAHHMDDQAETVLLHLLRGSGLSGARGMEIKKGEKYIRPMLNVTKNEIKKYINYYDIPYVEDQTNNEDIYQRNFIRNKLMPLINTRWPNAVDALVNFSKSCTEDDDYISSQVVYDALIFENSKTVKIPTTYFLNPPSLSSRLVFKALNMIGVYKDIEKKHVELIKNLAISGQNGAKIKLPMDVLVYKEYDFITLTNEQKEKNTNTWEFKCGTIHADGFGKIITRRAKDIDLKTLNDAPIENDDFQKNMLLIDVKKVPSNAKWRYREEGDFIVKFGGGTQKLKTYFTQKKVPLRQRDLTPVLAVKDEILVVAGIDISENVKIDENTKQAYVFEFKK